MVISYLPLIHSAFILFSNTRARFTGRDIPRYTEHQTVLAAPNRLPDRFDLTLDRTPKAPFWCSNLDV